ncbi:MAG: rubrerythrin family protein [Halanaerobiales bacterium]|nr:rubrerythrin family protein [Halanaerobiales bacterium]
MSKKTVENLKAAFAGESQARNKYTFFAKVARKEGWLEIAEEEGEKKAARYFRTVIDVEKHHAEVFADLKKRLENGEFLKSDESVKWKCRVCGYIHDGTTPPEVCPLCIHPAKHYEIYKG